MDDLNNQPSAIETFLSDYKIPLIFGIIGITFLLGAIILTFKAQENFPKEGVKITQESENLSQKIKVDIEGEVEKPGIYEVEAEKRIGDLILQAGGLKETADKDWIEKNLNLAQKLTDQSKVYIPKKGEAKKGEVAGSNITGKININTASLSQLESLPDIGPVRAQKIIDGRPYFKIEELLEKKIIGSATFEKIKDKISL